MKTLLERYIEDLKLRNYSKRTQERYQECVNQFSQHFGKSPEELRPEHIREYQLHLMKQNSSWSKFNQTVCALRFLYRATLGKDWMIEHIPFPRRERKLPVVMTRSEVAQFLKAIRTLKYRMALTTIYAASFTYTCCSEQWPRPCRFWQQTRNTLAPELGSSGCSTVGASN